jgi:hypothetical protein
MSQRRPLCKSSSLGGGIWRIKWHPYTPNRMLVAAMHAGCRVLNFQGESDNGNKSTDFLTATATSNGSNITDTCTKAFTEHESGNKSTDFLVSSASGNDSFGSKITDTCTKAFTEHESMAYGADWLVCPHPTQNGYFEAAARYSRARLTSVLYWTRALLRRLRVNSCIYSCSFYDRAVFLWDSVH